MEVDEALRLYLDGYVFEEIYDMICVDKELYKPLITDHVQKIHKRAYNTRKLWNDFRFRWDTVRQMLIGSGRDLSKIQIVPKDD